MHVPHVVDDDTPTPEPVLISHAIQAVLVAAVALQWVLLDNVQISAVVTAVGAIAAVAVAVVARGRVRAARTTDGHLQQPDPAPFDAEQLLAQIRDLIADELTLALTPPHPPAQAEVPFAQQPVQQTHAMPAVEPRDRDPAWNTENTWTPPQPRTRRPGP